MQLKLGALKLKIRTPICDNRVTLLLGDCLTSLHKIPSDSVDSIVTDPPYGLNFMEKKWDYGIPSVDIWKECLRVLKPGGHLLAFGGTRTYHRLVVAIEDAGFEIRDQIQWLYGQGFPKSQNIAKAAGDESLAGLGTALKPANEPICLARKPLSESTIAKNVLKHGTGGLNIDAGRVGTETRYNAPAANKPGGNSYDMSADGMPEDAEGNTVNGRFPSNVILDEDAAQVLDEQTKGVLHSAGKGRTKSIISEYNASSYHAPITRQCNRFEDFDNVGASRFFYVAKASKSDRGDGNVHPTVKPIKLMEYLIKLITQPNGVVLDPFMGSGSTGVAAKKLGFRFIGMEKEPEYLAIAKARIKGALCL